VVFDKVYSGLKGNIYIYIDAFFLWRADNFFSQNLCNNEIFSQWSLPVHFIPKQKSVSHNYESNFQYSGSVLKKLFICVCMCMPSCKNAKNVMDFRLANDIYTYYLYLCHFHHLFIYFFVSILPFLIM
jgi:hypothetical protein